MGQINILGSHQFKKERWLDWIIIVLFHKNVFFSHKTLDFFYITVLDYFNYLSVRCSCRILIVFFMYIFSVFSYNLGTCTNNRNKCSQFADCRDYSSGYCCHCRPGYYGNGIQCVAEGTVLFLLGFISNTVSVFI